jgi:serine/threonine protein kinase
VSESLHAAELRPGDVIDGRYLIEHAIGRGGMGIVYSARHQLTERRVAVKLLAPWRSERTRTSEYLLNEARTAAAVRHSHVVDVLDMGIHDDTPFLVMELLDGLSLEAAKSCAGLPADQVLAWLIPIMGALSLLHDHGIVHGDVKPSNIFLSKSGDAWLPKLLDFGLASAVYDPSLAHAQFLYGTPAYMAPERALGRGVDAQADVWSMGVVLFECLTGHTPAQPLDGRASAAPQADVVVRPLHTVRPDLPPPLAQAIDRALLRDPSQRHATMRAFVMSLAQASARSGVSLPRNPDPVGLPDFPRWSRAEEHEGRMIETLTVERDRSLSPGLVASGESLERASREGPRTRRSSLTGLFGVALALATSGLVLGGWSSRSGSDAQPGPAAFSPPTTTHELSTKSAEAGRALPAPAAAPSPGDHGTPTRARSSRARARTRAQRRAVDLAAPRAQLLAMNAPVVAEDEIGPLTVEGLTATDGAAVAAGRRAYEQAQDALALEAFEATYQRSGRVELLFNVGLAADRLRSDERALFAYEAFATAFPDLPEAVHARARSALLRSLLPKFGSRRDPRAATRGSANAERGPAREEAMATGAARFARSASLRDERPLAIPRALLVAGSLLSSGAIAGGLWWNDRVDAIHACAASSLCDNGATLERQKRGAMATTIILGTAAVGLVVTGALWLAQGKRLRSDASIPLAPRAKLHPSSLKLSF